MDGETNTHDSEFGRRLSAAIGGLLLAAASLGAAFWGGGPAWTRSPFVWLDVAAVSLLCAMPFAVGYGVRLSRRFSSATALFVATVLLAGVPALLHFGNAVGLVWWAEQWEWSLAALRAVSAVSASVGGVLFVAALARLGRGGTSTRGLNRSRWSFVVLLLVAAVVPEVYVDARCRRVRDRMLEHYNSERTVDAWNSARSLSVLRPSLTVTFGAQSQVTGIAQFAEMLQRRKEHLQRQLAVLETRDGSISQLRRAAILAQLSRRNEAAALLVPIAESGSPSEQLNACLLLGANDEHRERWQAALDRYRRALKLASQSPSASQQAAYAAALKGVGISSLKLGRYDEAGEAYRALIASAPTAANHFLLAQFYEETQRTDLARQHAQKAIELSPGRFRRPANALMDRLVTRQFRCFQDYLNINDREHGER